MCLFGGHILGNSICHHGLRHLVRKAAQLFRSVARSAAQIVPCYEPCISPCIRAYRLHLSMLTKAGLHSGTCAAGLKHKTLSWTFAAQRSASIPTSLVGSKLLAWKSSGRCNGNRVPCTYIFYIRYAEFRIIWKEGRKEEMDTQMEPQGVGPSLGMQFLFSKGLRVSGMGEKMENGNIFE